MITIKISNNVKVQKHLNNGLKFIIRYDKNKRLEWIIIKLNKDKLELLKFIVDLILKS